MYNNDYNSYMTKNNVFITEKLYNWQSQMWSLIYSLSREDIVIVESSFTKVLGEKKKQVLGFNPARDSMIPYNRILG